MIIAARCLFTLLRILRPITGQACYASNERLPKPEIVAITKGKQWRGMCSTAYRTRQYGGLLVDVQRPRRNESKYQRAQRHELLRKIRGPVKGSEGNNKIHDFRLLGPTSPRIRASREFLRDSNLCFKLTIRADFAMDAIPWIDRL